MKKLQLYLFFICLLSFNTYAKANVDYINAIVTIKQAVLYDFEDEITPFIKQFQLIKLKDSKTKRQQQLYKKIHIQSWGNKISDFCETMKLLFSFTPLAHQQQYRQRFTQALITIDQFRHKVNQLTSKYHPGYKLHANSLQSQYHGNKITIAVFDLFEQDLLQKQRNHYPQATIYPIQNFGKPVNLSHGNSVIDVILSIAPAATIIPLSADSEHSNDVMQYLANSPKINIINLSRAFVANGDNIDKQFAKLLVQLLRDKIITKSLGNTGSDLAGNLTPLRKSQDLPPVGNLFSYDLALIEEFINKNDDNTNLLFGINGNLLNDNIALTATIPGDNHKVAAQSFIQLADGIDSFSSNNFEAGSSFSAPQLAAVSALLWQALNKQQHLPKHNIATTIAQALKQTATPLPGLPSSTIGRGNINGDEALKLLINKTYMNTPHLDI